MITVYFETSDDAKTSNGVYAEVIAKFNSEELYHICLPALEKEAKKHRMIITESLTEEKL